MGDIKGPKIIFEIPEFFGFRVTETIRNGWILMIVISAILFCLTRNLKTKNPGKRQIIAEKLYLFFNDFVKNAMGEKYMAFAPYIAALFLFSILGSLSSLVGMRPMTGDLSTTLGWAILTAIMIQANNIRAHGLWGYLKGFASPIPIMAPMNVISEIATPISLSFRHFGNIVSGIVISNLLYGALAALSSVLLSWIPNAFISSIPIFQIGIPAILSIYFDLFTSFLQAYIFTMLTMVFISSAAE